MEDASGRCVVRRRFLIQLGTGEVKYMDGKQKKEFKPDSIKIVDSVSKHHAAADIWGFVSKHPREAIKKWLEVRAKISFLDISNPTRPAGATDSLQSIVYLSAASLFTALRASGIDGVFVRTFIENDQDRLIYRAAPLPMDTSRHGFRRTWIVRAASDPVETIIPHDFGVAVIKAAVAKRPVVTTERFQAPPRSSATFVRESMSNYPKSWAGVVAGAADQPPAVVPKKSGSDGAIAASAVQAAPRTQVLFPAHAPAEALKPTIHPVARSSALAAQLSPMDFASMMAATIEAALTPLREKLDATIGPMQRTIESLQAEFVAIREEQCDEAMHQAVSGAVPETQEAKRLRTGNGA